MKNKITFLPQLFKRGSLYVSLVCVLLMSATMKAQLPTARQIADKMKVGCNLGNTLEAICGEGAWGAGTTSQKIIDSIKAAGFNTIRLPSSWYCHSDTATNIIDADWIERVKEVVDYCMKDSLYTILNIHWDQGWLDYHINITDSARVKARQRAYWTQIAEYFKDYDEHLLFAGSNEPPAKDETGMSVLLSYHQTFIDAVRATGGNNSSRTLVVQGPSTDIDLTNQLMNTLPTDLIDNRLIVEVHYYTPYQFCLMQEDADWGKVFYYWGKGNHSTTDAARNANWGEESDVEKYFGMMKTKFVDNGIPVIIGEYGAYKRELSPPSDQALNDASVEYYDRYIVKSAISKGIIPYYWDTPGGLFDRSTGVVRDWGVVNAIMLGVKEASDTSITTSITELSSSVEFYPNPFTSTINIKLDNMDEITSIMIFDMTGKLVENIEKPDIKASITFGSGLDQGLYIVRFIRPNDTKSYKVIKH